MAADVTFFVGEEFTSFTELHRRIQSFQLRNSVQLYIRSSRKIQAAQVRSTDGYNPELKFAEIYYACVRGGRKFQSRGNATAVTTSRHYGRVEQSSSPQPSSLTFQNLFFVPKNNSGSGGGLPGSHPAIVFQPGANLGRVDEQGAATVKDEPVDSGDCSDCDVYLEPECILQYDEDKCFEPCTVDSKDGDGLNCGPSLRLTSIVPSCSHNKAEWSSGHKCVSHDGFNGGTNSGVVLQALKAVLNGDRGSVAEKKPDGEASATERYVVGRSDIEALTRFCSQCGARSLEMRSESQKDGSLLVASVCKGGHRIEWRFQRL
ncbi:hypothetical protein V5799_026970 [Amblyomma americanum]|uniref:ZSWIM3 N-terminal domain-containing protein n=1 Tax=Amblyomma americanum TaxID=6943 RepID=A0AAQ4DH22_AMBAM